MTDPIELLKREDKWYLGNGSLLIYAPPLPLFVRRPGFWDECNFGSLPLNRLLCLGFAAELADGWEEGREAAKGAARRLVELDPHLSFWHWYPDRIEAKHYLVVREGLGYKQQRGIRVFLNETRRLGPDGTLHCDIELEPLAGLPPTTLQIVAWTVQQSRGEGSGAQFELSADGRGLSYTLSPHDREGPGELPVAVQMHGTKKPASRELCPSHGARTELTLSGTPFWDSLASAGKFSGSDFADNALGSLVYAGLHWKSVVATGKGYKLGLRVNVSEAAAELPRGKARKLSTAATFAAAQQPAAPDPSAAWREYLELVPDFHCDNAMLTRQYWYRWYSLRLNSLPAGGNYSALGIAEGIGPFRGMITYSLMCHLREAKWLADPALAQGCLRNHIAHQTKSGHFPAHIFAHQVNSAGFYHTDVGGAVDELLAWHPDGSFAREIYAPLKKLLAFYRRERDSEGSNLFDLRDQYETGQEFSSRYFEADSRADSYGWEERLRLKGVDVTFYVWRLARLLERLAGGLSKVREQREFRALAAGIQAAVSEKMWDPRAKYFFDYNMQKGRRSRRWPASGLYPLMDELSTPQQALDAAKHLADPAKFAAPWPTPSIAVDDSHFSADPRWRGERANCPWNGRVWPMINSHVMEVYARLAELDPQQYRGSAADYLLRFMALLHFGKEGSREMGPGSRGKGQGARGKSAKSSVLEPLTLNLEPSSKDFGRPNCFEHYSPFDSSASEYRMVDDYMHSWTADLILKYVCGLRVKDGAIVVDPLPCGLRHFTLQNARLRGQRIDVCWNTNRAGHNAAGFSVYVDGEEVHRSREIERVEL